MLPKCSSALFISILTFLTIKHFQPHNVQAAPISQLLSPSPASSNSQFSPSILSSASSSSSSRPPVKSFTSKRSTRTNYHRPAKRARIPTDFHSSYTPPQPIHKNDDSNTLQFQEDQIQQQQPMVPVRSEMMWTDPTLEGHAVIDEDNDDDGNELLDTEPEGLWEDLYIEEEFDNSIEGQVLEEETLEDQYGINFDQGDVDNEDLMDLEDEAWVDVIRRLSLVAKLSRKEAVANSRSGIIGSSSTPVVSTQHGV